MSDPETPNVDTFEAARLGGHVQHVEVHVHHHFPDGVPVAIVEIADVLLGKARPAATTAVLHVGEKPAMTTAQVNVDTTNEVASLQYVDDHGDTDALAPVGVTVQFSTSDAAVLTVDADGKITVVGEGTAEVGVALANTDGTPWGEPVDPVAVTVAAGAPVGARLTVAEATPQGDGTGTTGTTEPTPETPTGGTVDTTGTADPAVQETPVPGEAGQS